jgi:hypothetical protein
MREGRLSTFAAGRGLLVGGELCSFLYRVLVGSIRLDGSLLPWSDSSSLAATGGGGTPRAATAAVGVPSVEVAARDAEIATALVAAALADPHGRAMAHVLDRVEGRVVERQEILSGLTDDERQMVETMRGYAKLSELSDEKLRDRAESLNVRAPDTRRALDLSWGAAGWSACPR